MPAVVGVAGPDQVAGGVGRPVGLEPVLPHQRRADAAAQLVFKLRGEAVVVEPLAGDRVVLEQLGGDHRAALVERDVAPDHAGRLADVLAYFLQRLRRGLEVARQDVAEVDAALDDLKVGQVRREQRGHVGAVHAGQEEGGVGELLELVQESRVIDVAAVRPGQGDRNEIGPAEGLLVLLEHLHVRVIERDVLLEARVRREQGRAPGEEHGERQQDDEAEMAPPVDERNHQPQDSRRAYAHRLLRSCSAAIVAGRSP